MGKNIKQAPVTSAEKDLKLTFIQNMNGNTKCNFCEYFVDNNCTASDYRGYHTTLDEDMKRKSEGCKNALKRLMEVLKS